jgi:hypothetical protein
MKDPDIFEQSIRLGCGAVFGLFLGLYVTRPLWHSGATLPLVTMGCVAAMAALLANRYGDGFWRNWQAFLLLLMAMVFAVAIIEARI